MNPTLAAAIAQGLFALVEIWRQSANKPPEWVPTEQDWEDMLAFNEKTASDYKKEAADRLGIAWPPSPV